MKIHSMLIGVEPEDFKDTLESIAAEKETDFKYRRQLSREEIQEVKEMIILEGQAKMEMEEKFADIKAEWTAKIKEKTIIVTEGYRKLKYEAEDKQGPVYLVDDQDLGIMQYVTEDGEVISSRPLLQSERQTRIPLRKIQNQ